MALTARVVEKLIRDASPGATADVRGLYLKISPSGAASWQYRYTFAGRRRAMGLGAAHAVTLAEARELASDARKMVVGGTDPIERRSAEATARRAKPVTFDEAAERFLAVKLIEFSNAKHREQWVTTLREYVTPVFGRKPVAEVTTADVLRCLNLIWTDRTETATRLRGRIEAVLSFAMQAGLRPQGLNPAQWRGVLDHLLPAPGRIAKPQHFPALPWAQVPAFMKALRVVGGQGARALELAVLTAARSGEVRGATWSEIDLDAALWTVPAARMKAGREHRVPLSPQASALLQALPRQSTTNLVFPSRNGNPISDMTLTATIRRMHEAKLDGGWVDPKQDGRVVTAHGFRSTFRDWAAEQTGASHETIEAALAHTISDKTVAAYFRADLLEKRRELMDRWCTYCFCMSLICEVNLTSRID